jgi:hypothetical protein
VAPIRCGCAVLADNLIIPPRLNGCRLHNETTQLNHTINVGLLRHFFSKDDILIKVPSLMTKEPFKYQTVKFQVANRTYHNLVQQDQQESVLLKQAIQRAKENKTIYTNPVDPIYLGDFEPDFKSSFSWTSPYSFVSYAVWIAIILLAILLYLQHVRIGALRIQLLLTQTTRAAVTDIWKWTPPTTTISDNKSESDSFEGLLNSIWRLEVLLLILALILLIGMAIYIYKIRFSSYSKVCLSLA